MITRRPVPAEARTSFDRFAESPRYRGRIFEDFIEQRGDHPSNWRDVESSFAVDSLREFSFPNSQLIDIGSNHLFVTGLCASRDITTVDVRPRVLTSRHETVVVADAARIPLPDRSFDVILSLNAIEHFGLGRYGDAINVDADFNAISEWRRLMRPGAVMIISTTISSQGDAIAFNAHRIYSHNTLCCLLAGMTALKEAFYSNAQRQFSSLNALNTPTFGWDLYLGAWRAPIP